MCLDLLLLLLLLLLLSLATPSSSPLRRYDLNARMMLPEDIFLDFVCELDPPMGFGLNRRLASEKLIKERLMILACVPEEVELADGSTQAVYTFDMAVQATAQLMILHQTDPGLIAKLDKLDPHMKKKAKSFSRKLHERKSRFGEKELEVVKEVVSLSKVRVRVRVDGGCGCDGS